MSKEQELTDYLNDIIITITDIKNADRIIVRPGKVV